MLAGIERSIRFASKVLFLAGSVAVFLMMAHVCVDVIFRVALKMNIYGTIEIASKYYMVAIAFLPIAALHISRDHLFVESFTVWLPDSVNRVIDRLVDVLCIAFAGIYIYSAIRQALAKTAVGASAETPAFFITIWPSYWLVPLGVGVFLLVAILHLFNRWERDMQQSGHSFEDD